MIQQWHDPWMQPVPLPLPGQVFADRVPPPCADGEPAAPARPAAQQSPPTAPVDYDYDAYQWMLLL